MPPPASRGGRPRLAAPPAPLATPTHPPLTPPPHRAPTAAGQAMLQLRPPVVATATPQVEAVAVVAEAVVGDEEVGEESLTIRAGEQGREQEKG